jgi:hypothetical protein
MRFGAKSARALSTFRHLCAFSCITTLFSSNGWCRVYFRVVSFGEFIYKLKNTIKCKKCGRTKALLGTYALFHMKLTLFSGSCSWVSILGNFLWRIYSHSQKSDSVQKVRGHSALPGTCVHFHVYLHIFPQMDDGCHFWVIFSGQFIWILKNAINCKTCVRTQALFSTYAHFYIKLQVVLHGCPYRQLSKEKM